MSEQDMGDVDRRTVLAGLSAAASMGIAGCGGGGDGGDGGDGGGEFTSSGDQELGERVPSLSVDFFATLGKINEDFAGASAQDLGERLNLNIEPNGREHTALVQDLYAGTRRSTLPMYIFALEPDPNTTTRRMMAHEAGSGIGTPGRNVASWTNCDYSVRADLQSKATSTEERQQLVNEAWSILSHEAPIIPISTRAYVGGYRTDQIQPDDDIWATDFAPHLFQSFLKISPGSEDTIVSADSGTMFELPGNPFLYTSQQHLANCLVRSPLLLYDKEAGYDINNLMAESVERSQGGELVTVTVRDDATFHNGDPVTAEDVKFTYDYGIAGTRAGTHTFAPSIPDLDEIVATGERTVEFRMNAPYSPLVDREFPTWGVIQKDAWMDYLSEEFGVESFDTHTKEFDSFGEVEITPDVQNGCGPYEMVNFTPSQSIELERVEDHPVHDPECDITFINRRDDASRLTALQGGQANAATLTPSQVRSVEDNENIMTVSEPRIQHYAFFTPNCAVAPTKFEEFRKAVAMVLNRQEMVEVSQRGLVEPEMYSVVYSESHPWRPPEDMLYKMADDPTGNPEQARQLLSDNGWGYDEDGNLHYPPDADLSEAWPEEGTPDPADYPCVGEEGFVMPEGYELSDDQVPGI